VSVKTLNARIVRNTAIALCTIGAVIGAGNVALSDVVVGTPVDIELSAAATDTYQVQFSPTHPSTKAYAVKYDQDQVAVINPTTGSVTATISVGDGPVAVAFTPDGNFAYVANYLGDSVTIIDTATETVDETIPVAGDPYDVTISADGRFAAFSCYDDDTLKVMSTSSHEIVKTYRMRHSGVWQARFTPDGKRIYAVGNNSGMVLVVDTTKQKVIKKVSMRGYPWWLEVSPDGTEVMVTDYNDGNSSVAIINVKKNKIVGRVAIGSSAYALAYAPDGDHVYVVNDATDEVSVIDTATRTIVDTFTASGSATLIPTINPAGTLGFLGDKYGYLTTFTPF
jgi:YVTN family beta-propeller protein